MDLMQRLAKRITKHDLRIVFPEYDDPRILVATETLAAEGIARPVIVGQRQAVLDACKEHKLTLEGVDILDASSGEPPEDFVTSLCERSGVSPLVARMVLTRPLYRAAALVAAGQADGLVAGCATETSEVVVAAKMAIGLDEGVDVPSLAYIMDAPAFGGQDDLFVISDPAINIDPGPAELASIAISSARSMRSILGIEPRVALISFSTHGSATHALVDKVTDAVAIVRERDPQLEVDGELQLDAAIIPRVAAAKTNRPSGVAGRANVLVMPGIEAGNVAVKLLLCLSGATGCSFMQGFSKPVSDMSRSATVDDIVLATMGVVLQAQARGES